MTEEESYYIEERVTVPKREEAPPTKGIHSFHYKILVVSSFWVLRCHYVFVSICGFCIMEICGCSSFTTLCKSAYCNLLKCLRSIGELNRKFQLPPRKLQELKVQISSSSGWCIFKENMFVLLSCFYMLTWVVCAYRDEWLSQIPSCTVTSVVCQHSKAHCDIVRNEKYCILIFFLIFLLILLIFLKFLKFVRN